jgi:hypothetical protein
MCSVWHGQIAAGTKVEARCDCKEEELKRRRFGEEGGSVEAIKGGDDE